MNDEVKVLEQATEVATKPGTKTMVLIGAAALLTGGVVLAAIKLVKYFKGKKQATEVEEKTDESHE